MRLAVGGVRVRPSYLSTTRHVPIQSCTVTQRANLGTRWREYQGSKNWEGLLDPIDDNLRAEILRYGKFVQAAYTSCDFDPSSPSYASCRFSKHDLLHRSGLPDSGYLTTKNLHATSGISPPRWAEKAPTWMSKQSSWIGYVAVTEDEEEIERLGRRDVVVAYRGTVTCMEWLENLRSMLTHLPESTSDLGPMVESGFWSLYTSRTPACPSLCEEVRDEIARILDKYRGEAISLTVTGHSLGAALAVLTAYDIKTTFRDSPLVTVFSFGGPRVGNRTFRRDVEENGSKVLRIVNTHDVITKLPGIVLEDDVADAEDCQQRSSMPSWVVRKLQDARWLYADVGCELRVSTGHSPYLSSHVGNVATCHELDVYLHLVNGFMSSTCPFRATARNEFLKMIPATTQAALFRRQKAHVS
ncbi:phospholipase A1 DAD1, chloroplastic [Cinnamomum micranthum f. kanehirae]|uniref:Phospholipase A1 DAD1, chloroplastic n=1 Tax=Cinnamomum micranthum f. kanehirae TaxID=337451 RepID=A0A3S3MN90_9MAGN|nr:phospholipase A1 DAD1, chloroplastic [Cinnamomum micranthum f. kanehirae]